jgi:hypothetical protein
MKTYTICIASIDDDGDFVNSYTARTLDEAKNAAFDACARAWDMATHDGLWLRFVMVGDVSVIEYHDRSEA